MEKISEIAGALSDVTRLRALLALRCGELCVCHLIDLLDLAPSTVSKHLSILKDAGLVESRKDGRWVHYRLADETAPEGVRLALAWALGALADDARARADLEQMASVVCKNKAELCACYKN